MRLNWINEKEDKLYKKQNKKLIKINKFDVKACMGFFTKIKVVKILATNLINKYGEKIVKLDQNIQICLENLEYLREKRNKNLFTNKIHNCNSVHNSPEKNEDKLMNDEVKKVKIEKNIKKSIEIKNNIKNIIENKFNCGHLKINIFNNPLKDLSNIVKKNFEKNNLRNIVHTKLINLKNELDEFYKKSSNENIYFKKIKRSYSNKNNKLI
jgi:hypothetical protein